MMAKKKQPQYIYSALNAPMLNYCVYYMSMPEKIQNFLIGFVGGGTAGLIFYGGQFRDADGIATQATMITNVIIFVVIGLLAAAIYFPARSKQLMKKRKNILIHQFRELLAALSVSLSSGMNMQESLASAYNDLKLEFSENAYIVQEVQEMIHGMQNNVPLEEMMNSLGKRSEIDDIRNFGVVFSMCYRTGGSLKDIVRRTSDILSEKMEISEEIETTISSNKMQLNVMMCFPIIIMLMLRTMSSSFSASFATVSGTIAITVALIIFYIAYRTGQKIIDIKG